MRPSVENIRFATAAIAHPTDVLVVARRHRRIRVGSVSIYFLSTRLRKGCFPFVDLGMPIRKCESSRAVVIRGWLVDPSRRTGIEEASVIDAARMFIQIDPRIHRAGENEVGCFEDMFVNVLPRAAFRIARAYPYVAGHATHPATPALGSLSRAHINVGGTLENRFGVFK